MNKRLTILFAGCLLISSLFTGCSKKAAKDETNCYISLDQAKAAAKKQKKPILAMITQEEGEQNGGSQYFVEHILMNKEFSKYCEKNYIQYRMDFSTKNIQKSAINDQASEEEQKAAREYSDYLQQGFQFARYLGVSYTPAFYILTKDGYFVTEVEYTEDSMNVEAFTELLTEYLKQVDYIESLVKATSNGSTEERLAAIDSLYSVTPTGGLFFLAEFAKKAVEIDPENKTGLVGKYYFIVADEKASQLYSEQDTAGAIQAYLDAAESGKMEPVYNQQCYYMAAWILESISAMDSDSLLDYLEKAYNAAPDSEYAQDILSSIEYYQTQFQSVMMEQSE